MMSLLRRLFHFDDADLISRSIDASLEENARAFAENHKAHTKAIGSTRELIHAAAIAKQGTQAFAEFELSIREKNDHGKNQLPL